MAACADSLDAEFADRSPPKVNVLLREVYLGADGEPATKDAHLRFELPRYLDTEFLTALSPKSSHDRLSRLDCTPRQPPR